MINNFKTELKEISEVFEFVRNGKSVKQVSNRKGVPITRIETISKKFIDVNKLGYADVDTNNLGNFENYLLKKGDILMSHINSPKHLGKTAIYKNIPRELIHGMNLLCLRNKENICNSNYAHYYFHSNYFFQDLQKISNKSVNQASFSVGKLKELKIPLPPLETQKQIAETLDNAAALRDKTQQLIAEYDQLAQSIFLDMFGDPVTNPMKWEKDKTINYSECIVPGRDKPKSFTGKTPWVTTNDLKHLNYTYGSKGQVGLNEHEISQVKAKVIPRGSVIITCVGDLGISTINSRNIVVNQQLHTFQCSERLNNIFLMFNLSFQKPYMYKMASSTTVPYMNKTIANNIPTIIPPIHLQNQFAEKIALIEQQKDLAKKELQESEDLFQALLQKAFRPAEKHDESELV